MDNLVIGIAIGLLALVLITIGQLRSDIVRMNITLEKISKHIGITDTITENIDAELKSLISEGKKIKAIKLYRQATGIGLKEAKDYIDLLDKKL